MAMKRNEKKPLGQIIMGVNCVREVLHTNPARLIKIYTSKKENDPLIKELEDQSIPIEIKNKKILSEIVASESHQGILAFVKERKNISLKEFLAKKLKTSTLLMLDSIEDPQNFGAILRAAECFGVDAVVWSKNRGAPLTPVVSKVSVGASELVPLIKVSNLAEAVNELQNHDYTVATTELNDKAIALSRFTRPSKLALILGSEGKGVQQLISKRADIKLTIPMLGKIDSLNVSQAAAVMLYHLTQQI